ncbi:MAG: hypothetical protein Q8N63_00840 [Nanoarchaeota archaeon]|nr:hypothetical protein [Nanoarchaeota archaeon]
MVNVLLMGNFVRSGISTFRKYKNKIREDPFGPEIIKLRKECGKWTSAIDIIGRECPHIGETCYDVEDNVMNYLSVIEGVSIPCARYNILIPNRVYFYTDPKRVEKIDREINPSFKRIYPKPEKAIFSMEKIIDDYISETEDIGYTDNFEKRKVETMGELLSSRKRIEFPYQAGFDYSAIQERLFETVKKMRGVEYDYLSRLQELEHKRNIRRAKIGAAAVATFAAGVVIGSKLKKTV